MRGRRDGQALVDTNFVVRLVQLRNKVILGFLCETLSLGDLVASTSIGEQTWSAIVKIEEGQRS